MSKHVMPSTLANSVWLWGPLEANCGKINGTSNVEQRDTAWYSLCGSGFNPQESKLSPGSSSVLIHPCIGTALLHHFMQLSAVSMAKFRSPTPSFAAISPKDLDLLGVWQHLTQPVISNPYVTRHQPVLFFNGLKSKALDILQVFIDVW